MHLFLVDSSIFVFRAWFGPDKEMMNLDQQPNQAFIGFTDFVHRLLSEQAPARIVFAFDESLKTSARKEIYADYKANRSPAPLELKRQFGWCQQWLDALGISRVSSGQWEADDLIGSLVRYHRGADLPVAILTADKDLTQLVAQGDLWWSYLDNYRLDYAAIMKKFGVRPEQIADLLALMGDKVDNIPGIPGVGRKTAANLLKKYHDLDALRQNLQEVGKMKFRYAMNVQRSLIENESLLDISARLTHINCDLEEMKSVRLTRQSPDAQGLQQLMQQQAMDSARQQRWQDFLESKTLQAACHG